MAKPGQIPSQIQAAVAEHDHAHYPLGVVIYYGPDAQTCTRVTAAVIKVPHARPEFRHWRGEAPHTDAQVIAEIGEFFRLHSVQTAVMTDGIVDCPHDEGVDYPTGESCPYCPYWSKQRNEQ